MRWLFCLIVVSFIIPVSAEAAQTASGSATTLPIFDEQSLQAAYTSYLNCHGAKIDSASCIDREAGDINHDGNLNDSDYNLILIGLSKIAARKQSEALTPTVMQPTPTVQIEQAMPVEQEPDTTPTVLIMVTKAVAIGGIVSMFLAAITGLTIAIRKRMRKGATRR